MTAFGTCTPILYVIYIIWMMYGKIRYIRSILILRLKLRSGVAQTHLDK